MALLPTAYHIADNDSTKLEIGICTGPRPLRVGQQVLDMHEQACVSVGVLGAELIVGLEQSTTLHVLKAERIRQQTTEQPHLDSQLRQRVWVPRIWPHPLSPPPQRPYIDTKQLGQPPLGQARRLPQVIQPLGKVLGELRRSRLVRPTAGVRPRHPLIHLPSGSGKHRPDASVEHHQVPIQQPPRLYSGV